MIGVGVATSGSARVAALGLGHSVAYALGAAYLGVGLARRVGRGLIPRHVGAVVAYASLLAALAWLAERALDPQTRLETVATLAALGALGAGAYVPVARRWLQSSSAAGAHT
jgi:hypothetical protein